MVNLWLPYLKQTDWEALFVVSASPQWVLQVLIINIMIINAS